MTLLSKLGKKEENLVWNLKEMESNARKKMGKLAFVEMSKTE